MILTLDSPLSYGILDYSVDAHSLNLIEFFWESTKECGIFFKVTARNILRRNLSLAVKAQFYELQTG